MKFFDSAALPATVSLGASSAAASQPGSAPPPVAFGQVPLAAVPEKAVAPPGTLFTPPLLPGVDPRSLLARSTEKGEPLLTASGTAAAPGGPASDLQGSATAAQANLNQAAYDAKSSLHSENATWSAASFDMNPIKGSIKDVLDKRIYVNKTLNLVSSIISVIELVYDVINFLQTDFDNLYKVLNILLEQLLKQLQDALVTLASTGVYLLPITPDLSSMDTVFAPGGGAQGALDKMDRKLFDTKDPNRPIFNGAHDYVGGFVVVMTTGSNVGDLIDNLNKLGHLLEGLISRGAVDAPKGVKATPGLYAKDIKWNPDDLTEAADNALALVRRYPGVKLEWEHPKDLYNAQKYAILRCRSQKGTPLLDSKGKPLTGPDGKPAYNFNDTAFNGPSVIGPDGLVSDYAPVLVDVPRGGKLSYTDFAVNDGMTYYYRVAPAFKSADGVRVVATALSQEAVAKVSTCVPDNDASKFVTETAAGFFDGVNEGDPPDWRNETLRSVLGPDLDLLFKKMAGFVEQFIGMTQTSSDHFEAQLENIKKFLARAKEFMAVVESVVQALEALKFSGGAMVLPLLPKPTGLQGFAGRIKKAKMSEKLKKYLAENSDLCSVTFALLVVVGYPSLDSVSDTFELSDADVKRLKDAGKFEATKASFDKLKSSLDSKSDEALGALGLSKKDVTDAAFSLFSKLLGAA